MLNLSRLGAVRCLFFKSEQYSLIEMPVQVGASVDKHGHVKAAHTRIQKVRVAKPPVAVRQSSLFDDEPEQKATKKSALDIASVANHAKAMGAIRGYLESSKLPGFAVMVDGDIQSMHSTVKRAVTWAEGNAPDSIVQKISVTDADKIEQTAKATPAAGIEFNLAPVDDHIPDSGQKVETSGGSSGGSGKPPPKKPPVTTGGDGEESQEENIEHGKDAMRKVVSIKDDVKHAMYRNGLGWVDFPFGYEGDKPNSKGRRKGAKGVSHIIEARMRKDGLTYDEAVAFLDNVVVCIAIGSHSESRYKDTKRNIEGTKSVVILNNVEVVLMRDDGSDAWLMT
ncbi:hypothetical protein, partial [Propionivibrio sp.]|uniref:putative barnase/colicin E5 family endoribonuclease n=1 Tax=Propionivibrio sp. TaxID=2212460 RepID=UPI003BF28039